MEILRCILILIGAIWMLAIFTYGLFKLHILLAVGFIFFVAIIIGFALIDDDMDDTCKDRWWY